jgi:hypothetical protein
MATPNAHPHTHNELEMARQFSETSARVSAALERTNKGKETPADLRKEVEMWEHKLPVDEMCARLNSNPTTGMTAEDAAARFALDGPNVLTPPKVTPWWISVRLRMTPPSSP